MAKVAGTGHIVIFTADFLLFFCILPAYEYPLQYPSVVGKGILSGVVQSFSRILLSGKAHPHKNVQIFLFKFQSLLNCFGAIVFISASHKAMGGFF